jgi:DUF4097 and DUF4098 domain-containing protein YvlB
VNGKIEIEDCRQELSARTTNGLIRVECHEPQTGSWELMTHNGKIDLNISKRTDAMLYMNTSVGKVKGAALPFELAGKIKNLTTKLGEGTHKIVLDSKVGSLSIDWV